MIVKYSTDSKINDDFPSNEELKDVCVQSCLFDKVHHLVSLELIDYDSAVKMCFYASFYNNFEKIKKLLDMFGDIDYTTENTFKTRKAIQRKTYTGEDPISLLGEERMDEREQ